MKFPDFSLEGKVALVTGGSKGLGRAIALTFAHAGADVAVSSRHLPECEEVAREIGGMGRRSLAVEADTSLRSNVDSMMAAIVKELGTLDILVNNAALNLRKRLIDTADEEFDRVMSVNLRGYFICSREAAKIMITRKSGVIINITSGAVRNPTPETGAYTVSKAAEAMLTECMARDLIRYNIRVNAIGPGPVRTEMNRIYWEDPEARAKAEARMTFRRFAEPEEITGAALLLASGASSYLTGQTIYFSNP